MISIDIKKYGDFAEVYFECVFRMLFHKHPYKDKDMKHKFRDGELLRSMIDSMIKCNPNNELQLDPSMTDINGAIRPAVIRDNSRKIILASPEDMRDVVISLEHSSTWRAIDDARDNLLEIFKANAYNSMRDIVPSQYLDPSDKNNKDLQVQIWNSAKKYKKRISLLIVEILNLWSCPYCNRDFINSREDSAGAQLDHFINEANYPYFCVSLYNLIPCCGNCNRLKSSTSSLKLISPLENSASFESAIKIRYYTRPVQVEGSSGLDKDIHMSNIQVAVESVGPDAERYKANIRTCKLQSVYEFHEEDAATYIALMDKYPKSRIREIAMQLARKSLSSQTLNILADEKIDHNSDEYDAAQNELNRNIALEVRALEKALFLKDTMEEGRHGEKPLSKFYQDLYEKHRRK